ncbi:MAG: lipase/acyltransferase domain-containing protein [Pyrinomonadaceae bacterium]
MTHVVVLVPGIMGSELWLDGEIIWPGPVRSLIFAYGNMAALMRDDLVATDIIRRYSISEQYGALIDDLGTCGFREQDAPPTLFVYPYDWRKSVSLAAAGLAELVGRAIALHGGELDVTLIGHSMGGLVCRYYLESGDHSHKPSTAHVRRLITLGTPHRGSPLALTAALGHEKRLFLSAEQVYLLGSDPRFPGLYHLLPPPGEPFAWDRAREAEFGHVDVYDHEVAGALGLVRDNLEAARAFHSKLDIAKRPDGVRYFFFVGTRQTTISHVSLLKRAAGFSAQRVELEDAGDGTVPSWSAGVTGIQNMPVGGEHHILYKSPEVRRTLAVLLGKAGVLAGDPDRVEVALRERVVNPSDNVHVSITFASGVNEVEGELRVEAARFDGAGQLLGYLPAVAAYPIRYMGLDAEKIGVIFRAPTRAGIYRIAYYPLGGGEHSGSDDLFVQA